MVGVLVLVSVNVNVVAVVPPDAGDTVKEATGSTGCGFTVTVPVFVLVPFRFVAVKVTVTVFALVPVFVNVCETGVPVTTGVPSPKFQDTLAAFVDVLVNSTVSGAIPEVALLLKLASGFGVGLFPLLYNRICGLVTTTCSIGCCKRYSVISCS